MIFWVAVAGNRPGNVAGSNFFSMSFGLFCERLEDRGRQTPLYVVGLDKNMGEFDWMTVLGLVAAFCTTGSFVPQVVKTVKTRNTGDISLLMYIVLTLGLFLWLVYGYLRGDIPLMAANSLSFSLSAVILILKIRYH